MRVEITLARTHPLPEGAPEALARKLTKHINHEFPDDNNQVSVRYAGTNGLSVTGQGKEAKDRISEILQEAWESADDWFRSN